MSYPRSLQSISNCKDGYLIIGMYESLLRIPPQATNEGGSSLQLKTKHAQTLCDRLPKTVSCLLKIRRSRAARKDSIYQSCNRRPSIVKAQECRRSLDLTMEHGKGYERWIELTATPVGTKSHLFSTKIRCLCGASSLMYFSTLLHRVPKGSRASKTWMTTSDESITL